MKRKAGVFLVVLLSIGVMGAFATLNTERAESIRAEGDREIAFAQAESLRAGTEAQRIDTLQSLVLVVVLGMVTFGLLITVLLLVLSNNNLNHKVQKLADPWLTDSNIYVDKG